MNKYNMGMFVGAGVMVVSGVCGWITRGTSAGIVSAAVWLSGLTFWTVCLCKLIKERK